MSRVVEEPLGSKLPRISPGVIKSGHVCPGVSVWDSMARISPRGLIVMNFPQVNQHLIS